MTPSTPANPDPDTPRLRALSLGAGVQSTVLLILSARGILPRVDYAAFADPGWERPETYATLNRLETEIARPAGIEIVRVSAGDIRRDATDPDSRFATMPLFITNPDGTRGMLRRQCTSNYKITVLLAEARRRLGAAVTDEGRVGRVKRGVFLEQWVGISIDEIHRAKDSGVAYARNRFPLLELGLSRADCERILAEEGFAATSRSACVGCPFTSNTGWRNLRDHHPAKWAEAVEFDRAIRAGSARANAAGNNLRGQAYLHPSRLPLDQAPIDPPAGARRLKLTDPVQDWNGDPDGCSPWACRSGEAAEPEIEAAK